MSKETLLKKQDAEKSGNSGNGQQPESGNRQLLQQLFSTLTPLLAPLLSQNGKDEFKKQTAVLISSIFHHAD